MTQRAVAVAVRYVVPVLISLRCPHRLDTLLTAVLATVLTALGFTFSAPAYPAWIGVFNAFVAILLIWMTVALGLGVRRTRLLEETNASLQREIQERRQAEERIREQAALLDQVPDAILVRDLEGRIRYWNRGAERLYGWTAAEALGRGVTELHLRAAGSELEAKQSDVLREGEWSGELRQITRDGKELIVEARWVLLRDGAGQPHAKLVVNTDVTDRKNLESQLLRTQRLESIGTLTAAIAHDFNNLLTPILMAGKLLKRDRPEEDRQHLLATIQASAERGAELVGQLLTFTGGLTSHLTVVQPGAIIEEVKAILEHTLPKTIQIRTAVPGDLRAICADPTQVSQVLVNLCINARDAMPGGGRLTITAEHAAHDEKSVRVHPDVKPGLFVLIAVADTGVGIPPEALDKVFDPFFTTKAAGKGTGLGLSTALGIVKNHGGFLTVTSKAGKGSRFVVHLPARTDTRLYPAAPERPDSVRGQGEWILVVDDERAIQATARQILEAHGYRVLTAGDGREALALFRKCRGEIRAVLVDTVMPVLGGPATLQALRELDPQVRTVAMSGLPTTGRLAAVAGENPFLRKPFTEDQMSVSCKACSSTPSCGRRGRAGPRIPVRFVHGWRSRESPPCTKSRPVRGDKVC